MNMWARFIFTPLLDDRTRLVDDGVPAAEYGLKQANEVHAKLRQLGGIRPPREFVFMDRAAIGLGGALIRLGARLNFHKLFEEEIANENLLTTDDVDKSRARNFEVRIGVVLLALACVPIFAPPTLA